VDTPADRRHGYQVETVAYLAIAAAGFGAMWWRGRSRPDRIRAALQSAFEPDAEVALHVANHEARQHGHGVTSMHLLYGLLQDEVIAEAIREAGHDVSALEDRVLEAIGNLLDSPELWDEGQQVLHFAAIASSHAGRRAGCVDLWAYLAHTHAATLLETTGVDRAGVLFRLVHKTAEPPLPPEDQRGDVHVVLRNDDYTTVELVCEILRDVFGMAEAEAETSMSKTHHEGRAIVGRFAVPEARSKVLAVRSRARAAGYPLWIGIEPT
jgi:ATP-dependent Clp protease adapter protein ClpS